MIGCTRGVLVPFAIPQSDLASLTLTAHVLRFWQFGMAHGVPHVTFVDTETSQDGEGKSFTSYILQVLLCPVWGSLEHRDCLIMVVFRVSSQAHTHAALFEM